MANQASISTQPEWHGIDKMSVSIDAPKAPPVMRPPINLVEAVTLVARAVTAKIQFHEREIAALRAALRPFHEAATTAPVQTNGLDADDAINQLLSLAGRINNATSQGQ